MAAVNFYQLFQQFAQLEIGVIGDVMLDTYWWGHVERISPEAPVPVVALDKKEQRIGGAGNVALNLSSLGAKASIISVLGKDEDGKQLTQLFEQHHINTSFLVASNSRVTTNKTRIISRNQQMMRLDAEMTTDINKDEEALLLENVALYIQKKKPTVIIFEDYNKGVLTSRVIEKVIALCKEAGVLTTVDPKKKNFFAYKGVDIFKPNLKEVKEGLNIQLEEINKEQLSRVHEELKRQLSHETSFITLSEYGVFYSNSKETNLLPSHRRNIADVSGAGDTVIAVASLVYAATKDLNLMASIANLAGGLVCEEVGTVAIKKERLLRECEAVVVN